MHATHGRRPHISVQAHTREIRIWCKAASRHGRRISALVRLVRTYDRYPSLALRRQIAAQWRLVKEAAQLSRRLYRAAFAFATAYSCAQCASYLVI